MRHLKLLPLLTALLLVGSAVFFGMGAGAQAIHLPGSLPEVPGGRNLLRRQLITYRVGSPSVLSNGTDTSNTYRERYPSAYAGNSLILVYANWYTTSGAHEQDGPNNIDVRASIEDPTLIGGQPDGTKCIPVFFNNGQRTVTIAPGALAFSDPVPIDVPAAWALFVRTNYDVTNYGASAKFPLSGRVIQGGSGTVQADGRGSNDGVTVGSDLTLSGTVTPASGNGGGPIAILALTNGIVKPAVIWLGHSIPNGTGDTFGFPATVAGTELEGPGYAVRGLSTYGIPCLQDTVGGESFQVFASPFSRFRRAELMNLGVNCAAIDFATNDTTGRSVAQMKADQLTVINAALRANLKVFVCTVVPKTTSTDHWTTAANQTPFTTPDGVDATYNTPELRRLAFNAYNRAPASAGAGNSVLADAPGLSGIIDCASKVEVDASNTLSLTGGRWSVGVVMVPAQTAGTVTNSGAVITDSRLNLTVNALTGARFYVDSGTGAAISTTVTTGATSATQLVGSTTGMATNQVYYFVTANVYATVSSVTDGTHVVFTASVTSTTGETLRQVSTALIKSNTATTITLASTIAVSNADTVYHVFDGSTSDGIHPDAARHQDMSTAITAGPFAVTMNADFTVPYRRIARAEIAPGILLALENPLFACAH